MKFAKIYRIFGLFHMKISLFTQFFGPVPGLRLKLVDISDIWQVKWNFAEIFAIFHMKSENEKWKYLMKYGVKNLNSEGEVEGEGFLVSNIQKQEISLFGRVGGC